MLIFKLIMAVFTSHLANVFIFLELIASMLICPRCGKIATGIYEKTIKGYRYLYCAHKRNGKIKWCYIGRVEKLPNKLPNSLPNFLRKKQDWCGGWDSNPRRPTPPDLDSGDTL